MVLFTSSVTLQQKSVLYVGAGNGNLIPFLLTNDIEHVPNVLKGIAGVRWFRRATRHHQWSLLTNGLFDGKVSPEEMAQIQAALARTLAEHREDYLCDPPYDDDVPEPGSPIQIVEPPFGENGPIPRPHVGPAAPTSDKDTITRNFKMLKVVSKFVKEKVMSTFTNSKKKQCQSQSTSGSKSQPVTSNGAPGNAVGGTRCLYHGSEATSGNTNDVSSKSTTETSFTEDLKKHQNPAEDKKQNSSDRHLTDRNNLSEDTNKDTHMQNGQNASISENDSDSKHSLATDSEPMFSLSSEVSGSSDTHYYTAVENPISDVTNGDGMKPVESISLDKGRDASRLFPPNITSAHGSFSDSDNEQVPVKSHSTD